MNVSSTSLHVAIPHRLQRGRVAVITPSCGSAALLRCATSVATQGLGNVQHYVFIDGESRRAAVEQALGEHLLHVTLLQLPNVTGEAGANHHRIYGAAPFLVNADYIAYLAEDNYYEPDHLSSMVEVAERHQLDWVYSLRKIVSDDGEFICEDNCASLGFWGSWPSVENQIDPSCYLIKHSIAVEAAAIWNRTGNFAEDLDSEKALCRWLISQKSKGFTSGAYTVNHRLSGSASSPAAKYYRYGNAEMDSIYKYYPWRNPVLEEIVEIRERRRFVAKSDPAREEISAALKRPTRLLSPRGLCHGCKGERHCSGCRAEKIRTAAG